MSRGYLPTRRLRERIDRSFNKSTPTAKHFAPMSVLGKVGRWLGISQIFDDIWDFFKILFWIVIGSILAVVLWRVGKTVYHAIKVASLQKCLNENSAELGKLNVQLGNLQAPAAPAAATPEATVEL